MEKKKQSVRHHSKVLLLSGILFIVTGFIQLFYSMNTGDGPTAALFLLLIFGFVTLTGAESGIRILIVLYAFVVIRTSGHDIQTAYYFLNRMINGSGINPSAYGVFSMLLRFLGIGLMAVFTLVRVKNRPKGVKFGAAAIMSTIAATILNLLYITGGRPEMLRYYPKLLIKGQFGAQIVWCAAVIFFVVGLLSSNEDVGMIIPETNRTAQEKDARKRLEERRTAMKNGSYQRQKTISQTTRVEPAPKHDYTPNYNANPFEVGRSSRAESLQDELKKMKQQ